MNKVFLFLVVVFLSISPAFSLDYDYSSTKRLPIKMKITKVVSTKEQIYEGQVLTFRVIEDVYYKNKSIVSKNQLINARIEMIISSGMNGFPSEIIVDDFDVPNIKDSQLISTYVKTGQNRSLIVYPIKWALTWLPGVGSLTNLIKGGHAKIRKNDIITIYYYPEWK